MEQHRPRVTGAQAANHRDPARPTGTSGTRAIGDAAITLSRSKVCPSCSTRFPADFRVCPRDATELESSSEPEQTEAPDPLIGSVLTDSYEIVRVIGEGGMGRVYEARHTRLPNKRFAIKVLHPELSRQPDIVHRFLREAEATSVLAHENIVGVLDVNRVPDGRPYIVAELLEGEQLRDYLERASKLSVQQAIHIGRQLCQALHAAHVNDIVHRDIKPENVFLVGDGEHRRVKVLDFGISRVGDGAGTMTKTGVIMGTPAYMPPEQARGQHVDRRADIYAVGAILYEAVTGSRPFDGPDQMATLAAVLTDDPPRPRTLDATLPPALELVIQKAMAKQPHERYRSMLELDAALAPFDQPGARPAAEYIARESEPAAAPHMNTLIKLEAWLRKNPQPERARSGLVLFSIAAACVATAGLLDATTSAIRWIRGSVTLTASEIVLAALLTFGVLITPALAWVRFVRARVWPSSPRAVDVLMRLKRVLVATLVTYATGALGLRLTGAALRSDPTDVLAWPGWGVVLPSAALAMAGVAAWVERVKTRR